ncbi:hypothetical protein FSP39_016629 [Pinctada imbricata]|uniref:E3 ubiquitin-protein ligase n=1 Tax=Pinctada imbricata TaxID=66713 RepID=A0AA88YKN5_PINIB|nr:hypothetical protein FSP39_016629 [Pinctada imbricata]
MAAPSEVTALLKRGKRSVASYFKAEWSRKSGSHKSFKEFMDYLFDPRRKSIDDVETIDWCRWLIAGGSTYDEYSKTVRSFDNAVTCGLVWTANFVAYRCRTCGISPCMSLCSDCFQGGNHEGHDFNMFRSQAGGACDCGDVSVMNKAGFCSRHGPDRQCCHLAPPTDLLTVAEAMMPRILLRLLHHFRDSTKSTVYRDTFSLAMDDAEHFLTFLHSLSDMGAAMRKVIGLALTDQMSYKFLTEVEEMPDFSNSYFVESQKNYLIERKNMAIPKKDDDHKDIEGLSQNLVHDCLLDELVFWMVKYEFPEKVVTLLLSLLPDDHYKEAFTKAFVKHYSRISLVLVNGLKRTLIANRVVHISVQLFSNEVLALQMVEKYDLLYTLIVSLNDMVEGALTESSLQDYQANLHMVVDCSKEMMKEHCYWPIVSDLINLLSHKRIAHIFLSDPKLVDMWLDLLSYFQGMNVNHRELSQHVEFESETYYAAFSAELEIASSPMWSLISHCRSKDHSGNSMIMIKVCLEALQDWFHVSSPLRRTPGVPNPYQLSFHLPLHRYLATFVAQSIQYQNLKLEDFNFNENTLKALLMHPLRIQVSIAEIYCSMWVRNGLQIKGQAMTYIQCHFCYSMVDADLFLMQVCACLLDPDYFVKNVIDSFHVSNWLSFSPETTRSSFKLETEQELAMLDATLSFFSTLLGIRTYLGINDKDLTRLEMSTILCIADRQHSQLMDMMPERSGMTGHGKELFEPTLAEIADYKEPNLEVSGGLQQGTYVPKGFLWETEYDPVHTNLRALYRKDFQSSVDRYTEHVRQSGKYSGKTPPWPPFRTPKEINGTFKSLYKILHCKTMHAFLFTILHKALKDSSIPESVLYLTIHLLDLALSLPPPNTSSTVKSFSGSVPDKDYTEWFSGSCVLQNVREQIKDVLVPVTVAGDFSDLSTTQESSFEEIFQMAPSALLASGGPITAAHSGHLPSVVPVPAAIHVDSDPCPLVPIHPVSSSSAKHDTSLPKYESKGVSTDQAQRLCVPVNDSIISALIKLHSKLSKKTGSYVPLSMCKRQTSDSVIGDGPFFVAKVLDKMSRLSTDCAKSIEESYRILVPKDASSGKKRDTAKEEDRRRKARERQQKLMNKFASQQKAFMEQNPDTEPLDDEEASCSSSASESFTSFNTEQEYDCVICGKTSTSAADKTIGLVVLLQATSVLGHRLQTEEPISLPMSKDAPSVSPTTCASVQKNRLNSFFNHFEESSSQMAVNIGWEGGVSVQTCGHYLHLDCHRSYLTSLRTQDLSQNLAVNKGEYWCPLCRQLANAVLPIVPAESRYTIAKPVSKDPKQMVLDIAELMVNRPITCRSRWVTKAMGDVMEDLSNTTYSAYKSFSSSQCSEGIHLFVCSVARTNLELEILQRGCKLTPDTSVTRKNCFVPLMHVLSMHSKIFTTKPYTNLWSHMTGISCDKEDTSGGSVSLYQKEVPLLLKDTTAILIQMILTLPETFEIEHYQCLIRVLYNVTYIQALASTSCKFTPDEREAWRTKGRHNAVSTMEGMLSHVITRLGLSHLYEDMDMDKDIPAICQSVWSPHSVDMAVQESLAPFLRVASLIKYHVFSKELPSIKPGVTEFQHLCSYLELSPFPASDISHLTSASCVKWVTDEPLTIARAWCTDLANFANSHASDAKTLLLINPTWYIPKLIDLPHQYYRLFQVYNSKQCSVCGGVPKDPALCLVCAQYLCFRQQCCLQQNVNECVQHSIQCGAGTGMYLLVNSSIVVVVRGPRATLWGSVYLDEHGEEDRDLKRGKPLYLSKQRYNLLYQQWISHSFDRSCKRWIWHQNRL